MEQGPSRGQGRTEQRQVLTQALRWEAGGEDGRMSWQEAETVPFPMVLFSLPGRRPCCWNINDVPEGLQTGRLWGWIYGWIPLALCVLNLGV